jgi:hypothetical protein
MLTRRAQPSDQWTERFGRACAFAGVFEFRVRMLAERTPPLERDALNMDLDPLRRALVGHYGSKIQPDDRELLIALPAIRNKLFHVQFSKAVGRIKRFDEELKDAGVLKADLETGEVVLVPQSSTANGTLYGWLLESARSGAFDSGSELLRRGISVIEFLLGFYDEISDATPGPAG